MLKLWTSKHHLLHHLSIAEPGNTHSLRNTGIMMKEADEGGVNVARNKSDYKSQMLTPTGLSPSEPADKYHQDPLQKLVFRPQEPAFTETLKSQAGVYLLPIIHQR